EAGKEQRVPAEKLATLLRIFKNRLRIIVFNVCNSRELAEAMRGHVDGAIGMDAAISDGAAVAFSTGFYVGLCSGLTLEEAFRCGWGFLPGPVEGYPVAMPYLALQRSTSGRLKLVSGKPSDPGGSPEHGPYGDKLTEHGPYGVELTHLDVVDRFKL